jgi:hypothetical protein
VAVDIGECLPIRVHYFEATSKASTVHGAGNRITASHSRVNRHTGAMTVGVEDLEAAWNFLNGPWGWEAAHGLGVHGGSYWAELKNGASRPT